MDIEVIDLIGRARTLPPDHEHVLAGALTGDLLLIRLEPGNYPVEWHDDRVEIITALQGQFTLLTEDGRAWPVIQGQCARVPPGLKHRWAPDSDATVLVAFCAIHHRQ